MRHAVIDGDDGLVPELGQDPDGGGTDLKRGPHAGAAGVAEAVEVGGGEGGGFEGGEDEGEDMVEVVACGVAGEEAMAGRGDEGVAGVGEDGAVEGDDSDADLVGGALDAEGDELVLGRHGN